MAGCGGTMSVHLRALTLVQQAARRAGDTLGRESLAVRLLSPAYGRALRALAGDAGVPWSINGEPFLIDARFRSQLGRDYEAAVAAYLRRRVRPGDVCLDVGANVGAYALQLARWTNPGGAVVAFEPNSAAAAVLRRHIRMNSLDRTVTVVASAVGSTPGEAVLHAMDAHGMSRLGSENPLLRARTVPVPVQVTTLDAYCETQGARPAWLVIDVEGAEKNVLEGARKIIACRSLRGIVVELHPDSWTAGGADEMRALLAELRLRAVPLTNQQDIFATHGAVALEPVAHG
jgi:FkbM family methyltransferase